MSYNNETNQQLSHPENKLFHPRSGNYPHRLPPGYSPTSSFVHTPITPPAASQYGDATASQAGGCACPLCSYGNNRPPQYQSPTLPPNLPHTSQHSSWQQQHNSFPSPQGGGEYYSPHAGYPQIPPNLNESNTSETIQSNRYGPMTQTETRQDHIPVDPREWSSHDVVRWIHWACNAFKLRNLYVERFQMNGKALCLMDLSMFLYRVPDGGERLYQDFQNRLQKALCQEKFR